MTWTKEPPTKPGFYWHVMDETDGEPELLSVEDTGEFGVEVWMFGCDYSSSMCPGGLWHPAEPPALPEITK